MKRPRVVDSKGGREVFSPEGRQLAYWEGQRRRRHPADPTVEAFVRPKLDFVLEHLRLPPSPRILDVGCGNGYFSYYLQHLGKTIGLDYSRTMLNQNPVRTLLQASALSLPCADASVDLGLCSNLLHHMVDPVAAVRELRRVSRRYVVISEPHRNNPAMLALGLVKREERESLRFTRSFVGAMAEQAGLTVLACETMGFVTPTRMPRAVVGLLSRFDGPHPLGAFIVLVAER